MDIETYSQEIQFRDAIRRGDTNAVIHILNTKPTFEMYQNIMALHEAAAYNFPDILYYLINSIEYNQCDIENACCKAIQANNTKCLDVFRAETDIDIEHLITRVRNITYYPHTIHKKLENDIPLTQFKSLTLE